MATARNTDLGIHSAGAHGGVTAIYNRYAYEDEKRQALEAWAGHLSELANLASNG